jgi:uncharacterized protein involved in outer membrane biogenesis
MRRWAWIAIGVPLALAALAGAAWLALDAWLESAGGRRAIERVLTEQGGYPVRLAGEFEVVLLPAPGVSGTDLRVLDPVSDASLLQAGRYAVELALRPLLRKELHVERLTLGELRFGEVGAGDDAFLVPEVSITGFAVDRPAGFRLDLGAYGEAAGTFTWRPAASQLDLEVDWGGFLFPRLTLGLRADYDAAGFWLGSIDAQVDGQAVMGSGCYRFDDAPGLHLDLRAARLDLDTLEYVLPDGGPGGDEGGPPVRVRLAAEEVLSGDAVGKGVVVNLGADPDCTRPGG